MPDEERSYLEEFANRISISYIHAAEEKAKEAEVNCVTDFHNEAWVGWYKPSVLEHIKGNQLVVLYFPYDENERWASFDKDKHKIEYDRLASLRGKHGGYYVLAQKQYSGYVAGWFYHDEMIEIDITKCTRFTVFAEAYCNFTKEGLVMHNRRLSAEIAKLNKTLHEKNLDLDALGMVWCTGNCKGGQFRYTEPKEITPEFLKHAELVVSRLKARGTTLKHELDKELKWNDDRVFAKIWHGIKYVVRRELWAKKVRKMFNKKTTNA
jgi:hypothetical protein